MHCSCELVYRFNHILIYCYVCVMYIQPSYLYLVVAYVTCKYKIFELYFVVAYLMATPTLCSCGSSYKYRETINHTRLWFQGGRVGLWQPAVVIVFPVCRFAYTALWNLLLLMQICIYRA